MLRQARVVRETADSKLALDEDQELAHLESSPQAWSSSCRLRSLCLLLSYLARPARDDAIRGQSNRVNLTLGRSPLQRLSCALPNYLVLVF